MRVEQKWTIQMKNSIDAVMLPQTDPFDKAVFYQYAVPKTVHGNRRRTGECPDQGRHSVHLLRQRIHICLSEQANTETA